jgi:hypothetical protein
MDYKPVLIILLLLFSAFGDKIDLTNLPFAAIMQRVEVVKPSEEFVAFSSSVIGDITGQDRIELALYCDSASEKLLELKDKKPKMSQIVDILVQSFEELYKDKYKDKYKDFSDSFISIPKHYTEDKDRFISSEEIQQMSLYYKGLAWNILTQ